MYEAFKELLKNTDVAYNEHFKMSTYSTVKIGGEAFAVFPKNKAQLIECINFLSKYSLRFRVVGRMSNTLAKTEGYEGVLVVSSRMNGCSVDEGTLKMESGCRLSSVAPMLSKLGVTGVEELVGIPGCVGGLVYQNASAHQRSVSDIFKSAEIYDCKSGTVLDINRDEMIFGYRHSLLSEHRNLILLSASFELNGRDDPSNIKDRIKLLAEKRRAKQPLRYPSLGSVFKRPSVGYAGQYIEMAGLKGYRIGGAMISPKHAGFIINTGNSSSEDFLLLMELAKSTVYEQFGIKLEREVEVLE